MSKIKKVALFLIVLVLGFQTGFTEESPILCYKKIGLDKFKTAHNPSIAKIDEGYLLSFRYIPDANQHWISLIGLVVLNEDFVPIQEPQILNTRLYNSTTPSQSEDARIFTYKEKLYIIYNDNMDVEDASLADRRDMYIAKLSSLKGKYRLSPPLKLIHAEKYFHKYWQKNWMPFEWNQTLLLVYSPTPHEILSPNLIHGTCQPLYTTLPRVKWQWGRMRGGTSPQLVDGEYLTFFHSGLETTSEVSNEQILWHYYMGAYTFSAEPPFEMTKMTSSPIKAEGFYTNSSYYKRVIYPGGFVIAGDLIYLAYGKDDSEIWIATIDKNKLLQQMKSCSLQH